MNSSLISTLLHAYRTTLSSEIIIFSENFYKVGSLHFSLGEIRAAFAQDYQGEEALDYLYREEWSGTNFNYQVLDGLSLYAENIGREKFSEILFCIWLQF